MVDMTEPPVSGAGTGPDARLAAGPVAADGTRRMVIVPRRPSLLRDYEAAAPRPRDELDEFIEDLFGATTDEQPGRFDLVLVGVGAVLLAWVGFLDGPDLALWLGIAAIVLGLALPIRALLKRYGSSRTGGIWRRVVDGGVLLDASHPATVALVDAYAHLLQMSCLQGTGDSRRAITAGHLAVMEVATYLDGQPPVGPARAHFVDVRTEAIEALTRQMLRSHDRWAARTSVVKPDPGQVDPSADGASAFGSLDALTRSGALAELEKLNEQLRRESADESS